MAMVIVRWASVVIERVMGFRVFGVWRVGNVTVGVVCWVVIGVRVFGVRRAGSGLGVRCGFGLGRIAVSARWCGFGWGGRVAVSARWARFMVWRVGKVEAGELGWWSGRVCGHVSCWGGVTDGRGCAGTVVRLVVAMLGGRPGVRGGWVVGWGSGGVGVGGVVGVVG